MSNWTVIQADDNDYGQCAHIYKDGELWSANCDIGDASLFVNEIDGLEARIAEVLESIKPEEHEKHVPGFVWETKWNTWRKAIEIAEGR